MMEARKGAALMTMGERIQSLRKEKGLSQEALGEALGVSRQAVSQWENGQSVPEMEKLVAMKGLFGCSLDQLVLDEAPADPAPAQVDPRAEIRKWRPVRPKRLVLAVGITILVMALVWLFQGREAPVPGAEAGREPRRLEMNELWTEGGALADFSGSITGVDYGAAILQLRLSARPARLGPEAAVSFLVDAGSQDMTVQAESQDGLTYTADCEIPMNRDIKVSVVLEENGREVIPAASWSNVDTHYEPDILLDLDGDCRWDPKAEVLVLDGTLEAEMILPRWAEAETYRPTAIGMIGNRYVLTGEPGVQYFAVPWQGDAPEEFPVRQRLEQTIPIAPGVRVEIRLLTEWKRENGSHSIDMVLAAAYREADGTFHMSFRPGDGRM